MVVLQIGFVSPDSDNSGLFTYDIVFFLDARWGVFKCINGQADWFSVRSACR